MASIVNPGSALNHTATLGASLIGTAREASVGAGLYRAAAGSASHNLPRRLVMRTAVLMVALGALAALAVGA
jgi:hypothetical protein